MDDPATADMKHRALTAFAGRSPECEDYVALALEQFPFDGALLLADASLAAELGRSEPFARIEKLLASNTDWVDGHRALAQLKIAFAIGDPFEFIERSLSANWDNPQLWHCYLSLLSSLDRNHEAMELTARLRKRVGNVPALCLLEARFAGLAGDPQYGATLLSGLPAALPDLDYQRLRNSLQRGSIEEAAELINQIELGQDMRLWALAELTWRATGDQRHEWLLHDGMLVQTVEVAMSDRHLSILSDLLRSLHHTKVAPPAQSLRNGTQTRGQLHLRTEPAVTALFTSFESALSSYAATLQDVPQAHPLFCNASKRLSIMASWSVRLVEGGFHVPHIHSEGLVSSAFYIVVPDAPGRDRGALELGRPPSDIRLPLDPIMEIEPKPGRLALFPTFLYHSTSPFGFGERLTAVFDAA